MLRVFWEAGVTPIGHRFLPSELLYAPLSESVQKRHRDLSLFKHVRAWHVLLLELSTYGHDPRSEVFKGQGEPVWLDPHLIHPEGVCQVYSI